MKVGSFKITIVQGSDENIPFAISIDGKEIGAHIFCYINDAGWEMIDIIETGGQTIHEIWNRLKILEGAEIK